MTVSGADPIATAHILGVILAGGTGERLGGVDKALLQLDGVALVSRVSARLAPQVGAVVISANGDPARFARLCDHEVLADEAPLGPLSGVLCGLDYAVRHGFSHVLSVAVDTPFFPKDLGAQLAQAGFALACDTAGDLHPTFGVWPVSLRAELRLSLQAGRRRLRGFARDHGAQECICGAPSAFFNINTPADMAGAEAVLRGETCFEPARDALVGDVLAHLDAAFSRCVGVETSAPDQAAGRVLAAPVRAQRASPASRCAAVDGFALGAGAGPWRLRVGRAAAGHPFQGALQTGQAVAILTGAQVPHGTQRVAMHERVIVTGDEVHAREGQSGGNIRERGEDFDAGEMLLPAGRRLEARALALLAAGVVREVAVCHPLRVGILSTGDEVKPVDQVRAPHEIADVNGPMLRSLVAGWGFEVVALGHAPDDESALRDTLNAAAGRVDVLLTSGGAASGQEDHLARLMQAEGRAQQWHVAMKPGRPLVTGQWRGMAVMGLPGNPVAAFTSAQIFAWPLLARLAGESYAPRIVTLPAEFSFSKRAGRREFLRGWLTDAGGRVAMHPSTSSAHVSSLAQAEGLIDLPETVTQVQKGDLVRFRLLS
ncbi:Molybdopterin molybdenumtransferase [Aquimixticola soesokkakensis]|uniref:Molybdenum cofactor guanylyltransferase n=1 Tax=Aquimixticola soesokkakensis TaxID=1519096 RepID=A0A1Y5RNK3_9RHOB|nr:NTP transferase domain-containing protein [Aquimixticola soesokkakensis]SLN21252.1 Molybdopterin molybdenumtransferase [Aquimixticola soesokkakensis]